MKKFGITCFIGGVLFTCIIISILLYVLSMPQKNQIKFDKAPEGFAIMLFDEEENNYVEVENIPVGMYQLNNDKSYCTNGGTIDSYDRKTGKLNYSVEGTDECVIYLDIIQDTNPPVFTSCSLYIGHTSYIRFDEPIYNIESICYQVSSNVNDCNWLNRENSSGSYVIWNNDDNDETDRINIHVFSVSGGSDGSVVYFWARDYAGNIGSTNCVISSVGSVN